MYKIVCTYAGGAVAVPTEIIDKNLKLASAASFKVLLFIFRNPEGVKNAEQVALCTGLSKQDAEDCLLFWEERGVIKKDGEENEEKAKEAVSNLKTADISVSVPAEKAKPAKPAVVKLPTQSEVARRLSQDEMLAATNAEAQLILGTYGYRMQAVIVLLYDYYGFSPEMIITLLQYQKDSGLPTPDAVKRRGEAWAKKGISSMDDVTRELKDLSVINSVYSDVRAYLGLLPKSPAGKTADYLREWAVTMDFSSEMILLALKNEGKSFSSADKALRKWFKAGIKSPEDVKEKQKKSIPEEYKKSYDTESIGKSGVLQMLKKMKEEGDRT